MVSVAFCRRGNATYRSFFREQRCQSKQRRSVLTTTMEKEFQDKHHISSEVEHECIESSKKQLNVFSAIEAEQQSDVIMMPMKCTRPCQRKKRLQKLHPKTVLQSRNREKKRPQARVLLLQNLHSQKALWAGRWLLCYVMLCGFKWFKATEKVYTALLCVSMLMSIRLV